MRSDLSHRYRCSKRRCQAVKVISQISKCTVCLTLAQFERSRRDHETSISCCGGNLGSSASGPWQYEALILGVGNQSHRCHPYNHSAQGDRVLYRLQIVREQIDGQSTSQHRSLIRDSYPRKPVLNRLGTRLPKVPVRARDGERQLSGQWQKHDSCQRQLRKRKGRGVENPSTSPCPVRNQIRCRASASNRQPDVHCTILSRGGPTTLTPPVKRSTVSSAKPWKGKRFEHGGTCWNLDSAGTRGPSLRAAPELVD